MRPDCISNRCIKIIVAYVISKQGHYESLFEGIPYPTARYASPDEFFLNEDEWTTEGNYHQIFRRAKEMVGEAYFYFYCGASTSDLRSWGRLDYFTAIFATPCDGFRRLPFFNKSFNDTKEIEVIKPPSYDRAFGKIRTILKIQCRRDFDVHEDYIGDPFLRGILSSIPSIWGLRPATVKQPLSPYDPEILFKKEPELAPFGLDAKLEDPFLTVMDPLSGKRRRVGRKIRLQPEQVDGKEVFLGRYEELEGGRTKLSREGPEAILIDQTVKADGRILLKEGEIFKAPYFILDVSYDRLGLIDRLSHIFKHFGSRKEPGKGLIETINRLNESMAARNQAYQELEEVNRALREAKSRVDEYAITLEQKVVERTSELRAAHGELTCLNRDLEKKVQVQVEELNRYHELRRYLSPKLTERILSSGKPLGAEPQRKMMTVVFTDIRNFSTLTESLEPEELFHLLDRYLSEMTKIIHRYEGTLNKIIGDGLLIFFGDPIPMEDHAQRAVMMAVDMQKKVAELREEWLQFGHELGIGIGINTGFMSVGNIGSDNHKDYTVIGNQVNVSARLESLAKPGQILISQRTYSRVRSFVEVRNEGEIQVKGIRNPVIIYQVRAC
ncbi:MAG: adenylate/guanylate cyclase domain-containing protein [Pseudomonadota bacterium]